MGLVQLRLQAGIMLGLKPAFSHLPLGLREKQKTLLWFVVLFLAEQRTTHAF